MIEQLLAEPVRLPAGVEKQAMLAYPWRPEIVGDSPDGKHQPVVTDSVTPDEFRSVVIKYGCDDDLACLAIDGLQAAEKEAVTPPMAVAAVANLVKVGIERACCNLVQERLPNVGVVAFNEDDVKILAPIMGAELPDEFEPARAAANHHDLRL